MKIYLVRHLPTEWNRNHLLQGKRDIPISKPSREYRIEIEENKSRLNNQCFNIVLTSTLKRTQQTANEYGFSDFQIEPLLDELDFGIYEGQPKRNLINNTGNAWFLNPKSITLGEDLQEFEDRLKKFLFKYNEHKQILIFGHGAVIRALVSIINDGNIDVMNSIDIKNNSITVL